MNQQPTRHGTKHNPTAGSLHCRFVGERLLSTGFWKGAGRKLERGALLIFPLTDAVASTQRQGGNRRGTGAVNEPGGLGRTRRAALGIGNGAQLSLLGVAGGAGVAKTVWGRAAREPRVTLCWRPRLWFRPPLLLRRRWGRVGWRAERR